MILDACCGSMRMYHHWETKADEQLITIDIRAQDEIIYEYKTCTRKRIFAIKPKVKADMRFLPFKNGTFSLIICDPPYLDFGLARFFTDQYGSWTKGEVIKTIRVANEEFKRVLTKDGILILKVFAKQRVLYECLLNNFTFFLPIEYKSQSHLSSEKVGWYVATLRQTVQTEPSADDSGSLGQQDQQLPATQPRLEPSAP